MLEVKKGTIQTTEYDASGSGNTIYTYDLILTDDGVNRFMYIFYGGDDVVSDVASIPSLTQMSVERVMQTYTRKGYVVDMEWTTELYDVSGHAIAANDDLDSITTPGVYYKPTSSTTITTEPTGISGTYILEVFQASTSGALIQRLTVCNKDTHITYERAFYSSAWGYWHTKSFNGQIVLWSGSEQMLDTKTITLSKRVASMSKGITLVFSGTTDGAASNSNFHIFYVPKYFAANHSGGGVAFFLHNSDFSKIGRKYLYISDTTIKGHAKNSDTGTGSGITYNNNYYVLRYVLGE